MAEKRNVHQRLAEAMREVKYIQNEKKLGMQYRIVSHDKVTAKVRPALLDAGIVYYPVRCDYVQSGNRTECSITVRFVNIDDPADFFDVPTLGFGVDGQDKGPGKAMSYAVKYALLKALGLETGEDPDEDADAPPYTPQNPHPLPADIEPIQRNPVEVSAALVDIVNKAQNGGVLDARLKSAKFSEAWQWLDDEHPDEALKVRRAVDAAQMKFAAPEAAE